MATMVGTKLKLNLRIDLPGRLTMDDVDFEVDFFVYPSRKVTLRKEDGARVDQDNYLFLLDTAKTGEVRMTVRAIIPDTDFGDRLEIESESTKIKVL